MKFSRAGLFFCGFALLLAGYFGQRTYSFLHRSFTHGSLACIDTEDLKYREADMILYYYVNGKEYHVTTHESTELAYRPLEVCFPTDAPDKGSIYTIGRFWVLPLLWLLLPLMFWGAFVFTLLREDGKLEIRFSCARKECNKNKQLAFKERLEKNQEDL
ncbi:MAG: hypothetical protein J5642_06295 [Bacteroidales bacterium]|nr:hypothetical protein [Bacteroidales bacterium]